MDEDMNVKDLLKKMNDNFEKLINSRETKKTKLPWSARLSRRKIKKGWVTIAYINDNREVQFLKVPANESTTMIKDAPYLATTGDMLTYKGKPFIIQPSWSIEPFSPNKSYDTAVAENKLAVGYRLLLNTMKREQLELKKKFSMVGMIIGILVLGGIAWYFLKSGGI